MRRSAVARVWCLVVWRFDASSSGGIEKKVWKAKNVRKVEARDEG
jgi:hypothetical protein